MNQSELQIKWWQHITLFVVASLTAFVSGFYFSDASPWVLESWTRADVLFDAGLYATAVIGILLAHELGHYLHCLKYGVVATPPYFLPGIPIPGLGVIPFIGTFGAFIRMEIAPMTPGALLRIGAWGPIAGFVVTVPVLMVGFSLSEVRPLPEDIETALVLGDSLILLAGEAIFHPNIPEGHDVFLHPLAMAGWVGCFLTALNLMPVGQLDGGHIAYSVFGEKYNRVAVGLFSLMILLGLVFFLGWLVIALLVWKLGIRHPAITRGEVEEGAAAWPAWVCLVIFVLTFAPAPITGGSIPEMLGWW